MSATVSNIDAAVKAGRLPAIDAACLILGALDAPHLAETFERAAMRYRSRTEGARNKGRPEWDAKQKDRDFAADLGVHMTGKQRARVWAITDDRVVEAVLSAHRAGYPLTSPECSDHSAFTEAGRVLGFGMVVTAISLRPWAI